MKLEPMINVRFKKFIEQYCLGNLQDDKAFEYYINFLIFSLHQNDFVSGKMELLESSTVGNGGDCGIDGIGIKINDSFIESLDEVKSLINSKIKLTIQFVFIQSKFKNSISASELLVFFRGVIDILSSDINRNMNDSIKEWREIIQFLLTDDSAILLWSESPSINLYYASLGNENGNKDIESYIDNFKKELDELNSFSNCSVMIVDAKRLKKIIDNNENNFETIMAFNDSIPFPEVDGVSNSVLIYTDSDELVKLLSVEKGVIRKSLFYDNVRAYQGDTSINQEIENTIKTEPQKFILLNNGITLVCDNFNTANRKITIKNPQIVNGCQTCNVIFDYYTKNNIQNLKMPISIKIIASKDDKIVNTIVRTTNRQNIVQPEVFEITREFHKELEHFFEIQNDSNELLDIYYERRSRQYSNENISPQQRITLRQLTQLSVAILFEAPHQSFLHESKILSDYKDILYKNSHSYYPYYVVSLMYCTLINQIKCNKHYNKRYRPFHHHLLLIYKLMIAGKMPSLDRDKQVDSYFEKIFTHLKNVQETDINKILTFFNETTKLWTKNMNLDARKSNEKFTKLLINNILINNDKTKDKFEAEFLRTKIGRVIKIGKDRNDKWFGIITGTPNNIFFFETTSNVVNFSKLYGEFVEYNVKVGIRGEDYATDVKKINF